MSYGMNIYDGSGNLSFTTESKAISIYDVISTVNASSGTQTYSKSYPELAGNTIDFQIVASCDANAMTYPFNGQMPIHPSVSISYSGGYPTITWVVSSTNRYRTIATSLFVFMLQPSSESNYGWQVVNSQNEIISSDFSANYKLHSVVTPTTPTQISVAMQYRSRTTISAPSYPLIFVQNIIEQKACVNRIYNNGNGTYSVDIHTDSSSTPKLYIFVKRSSSEALTGNGVAVYDASGNPLWSSTDNVINPSAYAITTPAGTTPSTSNLLWQLNDTALMSLVGTIPTNSASFCGANYQYSDQRYWSSAGSTWTKLFISAVKKSSNGNAYSGWLSWALNEGGYGTVMHNTAYQHRVYFIDTTNLG